MTTLRQAHRKKYTCISNSLSQNNNLSLASRGLLLYLLSLPDDWKIHVNHLVSVMKEGKYTIMKLLAELKEAGYIYHQKEGYKEGWNYYVFEEPITPEEFKNFLRTIDVSEQFEILNNSENSHYKILKEKDKVIKKEIDKEKTSRKSRSPAASAITLNSSERCFEGITEKDIQAWRVTYPSVNVEKELRECIEWAMGTSRANYRRSINKWLHNANQNHSTPYQQKSEEVKSSSSAPAVQEKNERLAKDIISICENEKVNHVYKIELCPGGIRFYKPGNEGAVDVSFCMEYREFLQACRRHLTKLKTLHPSFNIYFKADYDVN